jgi:hypothetical protein
VNKKLVFLLFATSFYLNIFLCQEERTWTIQLLAVGCLYLAAKIDETDVPQNADMQVYYFCLMFVQV